MTAALTLGLTGRYVRQGNDAAEGVRLWAESAGVNLILVDDRGSREAAVEAYRGWIDQGDVDVLLGPYSSGLMRAVVPLVRDTGRLLFNHGGSADDLAQPGVVCLPAPASSYFHGTVDQALARQVERIVIVQGPGPFARAVAGGAAARARERGVAVRTVSADALAGEDIAAAAVLVVGHFEHDAGVVGDLRRREQEPPLLAAVAAGIHAFARELGEAAEGVLGPVHWWPSARTPAIPPSGSDFAAAYQERVGREPSYVAALAAAAGYLAHAVHRQGRAGKDVPGWATSTLLGNFELDADWRQVGHHVTTIRWHGGRMEPIGREPAADESADAQPSS